MQTRKNDFVLALGVMTLLAFAACSAEGPSTPTPMTPTGNHLQSLEGSGLQVDEDFNCANTTGARARFDTPGFVKFNAVGYYVRFEGVEDTNMELRVAWDYNGEPSATEQYEVIELTDEDVTRQGETLTIEKVIEHSYDVNATTNKRARVELMLADQVGNCAKVRDVTVAPLPPASSCNVTTGSRLDMRAASSGPGLGVRVVGDFVFPFAPGTALANEAVPVSIRTNPKPGTPAGEWEYLDHGNSSYMLHGGNVYEVTGGSCGVSMRRRR